MPMKGISIFAKLPFLNIHPHVPFNGQRRGKLMRISSLIRCQQVAEHIGARVNPVSDYADDVCIYVKPGFMFNDRFVENAYIDVLDDKRSIYVLSDHPKFIAIASSIMNEQVIASLVKNKVILIPQHHNNYERARRVSDQIKTIGMNGNTDLMPYFPNSLKEEIFKRGIKLTSNGYIYSRQDDVEYYKTLDLQVVWRPYATWTGNPLKIINAASFGIPTIALKEPGFIDVDGFYIPVENEIEFIEILDDLINDRSLYNHYSERCLEMSENYHIDRIGKLYKELQEN